jgi:hypothetical protein
MAQADPIHDDYLAVVEMVHRALSSTQAPYCVIGALALGIWGTPRATYDIDLLILAQHTNPEPFLGLLLRAGFSINESWHHANPMAHEVVLRLSHSTVPHFPVDLVFSRGPFERAVLDQRRAVDLHGLTIWMSSPEDLIMMKLRAGRPRDFDDVISIVKNPRLQLDLAYLWSWADQLSLHGELHYVLQAAGSHNDPA